jgi:hypothetical protein
VNIKIFIALSLLISSAMAEEIKLASPRNPVIKINDASVPWQINVSFKSLKSSSKGRSKSINRLLSESYLRKALFVKLNVKPQESLVFQGLALIHTNTANDITSTSYTLESVEKNFSNRKEKVINTQHDNALTENKNSVNVASSAKHNNSFKSSHSILFDKKNDLTKTIDSLSQIFITEFPIAPNQESTPEDIDIFFNRVFDAEQDINSEFTLMQKEIEDDKLLLSIERTEIIKHLKDTKINLINQLSDHAKILDK